MQEKKIHLIRHGEGFHNLKSKVEIELLFDASLTARGWSQTTELRKYMKDESLFDGIELVVVSPLRRTLQTASGVFGEDSKSEGSSLLMVEGVGKFGHPEMYKPSCRPPFVANELCREVMNPKQSNRRRPVSITRLEFPSVDLSDLENEDVLWKPEGESCEEIHMRARAFIEWLFARPEKEIAVVSHGNFLGKVVKMLCEDYGVKDATRTSFRKCELRILGGDRIVDKFVPSNI